ncbi:cobalamin biosynthesis protein [Mastigocladopsis repens]|uniref:cobalamin biosynthesis protein n=1 Tax=Mastigocladopsis repens TaxID=221287 RepID=UPI0002DE600B|nr:cobalamin biosynthesis protein [Mastigocladopsis repens]
MEFIPAEVYWHPRVLWVGIGCTGGTSRQLIERAIQQVFREHQLAESAIAGIATIDIKSHEVGLVELCKERNLPLKTFSCDVLSKVCVPNPSKVVTKQVGTRSVAEAAAVCAASDLIPLECPQNGQTTEGLGVKLLVSKQIFRLEGQPGVVTVAVAQAEKE